MKELGGGGESGLRLISQDALGKRQREAGKVSHEAPSGRCSHHSSQMHQDKQLLEDTVAQERVTRDKKRLAQLGKRGEGQ